MSKQQHSASLQIVEDNQDIIEISQNSFHVEVQQTNQFLHHQKIDDTFQLSLDENSLSFQIQELKQQSNYKKPMMDNKLMSQIKVQNCFIRNEPIQDKKPLPIVQEQRKRKRKQIFQKYKQKTTQNLLASPQLQPVSNDLMNTFDEIFKIKSPQKNYQKQQKLKKQISEPQSVAVNGFKKKQSVVGMSQTSFDYMPVTFTSHNQKVQQIQSIGIKVQNKPSISQFQIPSQISEPKVIDPQSNMMIGSTNSFIIDSDVNKISMIYPHQQQVSRDSADLQTFLKSELFKDDILDNTIRRTDTSYKSIQVSMVNPSIMISEHNQTINNKNFNLEQRFGQNKDKIEPNFNKAQKRQQDVKNFQQKNIQVFQTITLPQQKIVKQKVLSYPQNRIPVYLREIRRRNTIYPNFLLKSKSQNFYKQQNIAFKELLSQFKKGLTFLQQINESAYERFTVLTSLEKVLLNSLTLENFLTSGWQIIYTFKQLDKLKPQQNFLKRNYEYEKVKGALNNYLYIVSYYQKCNLNLQDEKAQKKYLEIRGKFWQIEKNIKMIGQDIYLLSIVQIFPQHYYEYLDILKNPFSRCKTQNQLKNFTKMLAKYYNLRQSGDLLSLSQIGRCVKAKLQKMIQKVFIV